MVHACHMDVTCRLYTSGMCHIHGGGDAVATHMCVLLIAYACICVCFQIIMSAYWYTYLATVVI